MFWHLLLSEQREQLGRQLLCCPGRQLIAVFAKARDRRQCRGKSRRQYKRTDCGRGADHCYTPDDVDLFYSCTRVAFARQSKSRQRASRWGSIEGRITGLSVSSAM